MTGGHLLAAPVTSTPPSVTSCHHLTSPCHFSYLVGEEVTGSDQCASAKYYILRTRCILLFTS